MLVWWSSTFSTMPSSFVELCTIFITTPVPPVDCELCGGVGSFMSSSCQLQSFSFFFSCLFHFLLLCILWFVQLDILVFLRSNTLEVTQTHQFAIWNVFKKSFFQSAINILHSTKWLMTLEPQKQTWSVLFCVYE